MKFLIVLAKKLSPILAFTVLWTVVVLKYVDWKYFNNRTAIFLLIPVFGVFVLSVVREFLRHKEEMAKRDQQHQNPS